MSKKSVAKWALAGMLLLPISCIDGKEVLTHGGAHMQSFSIATTQLPNEKAPLVNKMVVEQGGVLHIEGKISSPDMTSYLEKGACLYVRFLNRIGGNVPVDGQGLRYSSMFKCGHTTFRCGPENVFIDMNIQVPNSAIMAEIGIAKLKNPHTLVLSRK